jgi:nicotinate-nucleotide adenylyltransferase
MTAATDPASEAPGRKTRIGVFGGTFDPVHFGHLIVAEQCREQGQLDVVLFVPAARPPHKQDQDVTAFARRVEMLNLAIAGHPAFAVDEIEKDRNGPSYTVDTLEALRNRDPHVDFVLIVGADCLPDLQSWRQPFRIGELAELLVVDRPGWNAAPQLAAST